MRFWSQILNDENDKINEEIYLLVYIHHSKQNFSDNFVVILSKQMVPW
jgi:hypothetical protein